MLAGVTRLFDRPPEIAPGIHPSAVIDPSAEIGAGAAIGPFVSSVPGSGSGRGARILSHVSIAEDAVIGRDALLLTGCGSGRGSGSATASSPSRAR